jgi:hypothetical protein
VAHLKIIASPYRDANLLGALQSRVMTNIISAHLRLAVLDLAQTPIEDASVVWPEELSPHVTVARITAQPPEAYIRGR